MSIDRVLTKAPGQCPIELVQKWDDLFQMRLSTQSPKNPNLTRFVVKGATKPGRLGEICLF